MRGYTDPHDCWEGLKESYASWTVSRKLWLLRKVVTICMNTEKIHLTETGTSHEVWHVRVGHAHQPHLLALFWTISHRSPHSPFSLDHGTHVLPAFKENEPLYHSQNSHSSTSCPLELVMADLCGPFRIPSCSRAKYFLSSIWRLLTQIWIYFLKRKFYIFDTLIQFQREVKRSTGLKILKCQSDRGEFTSLEFIEYCRKNGIYRE